MKLNNVGYRCLPNCGGTSYDITVTSAPFRHCDQANMGLTRLCDLDTKLSPQKWADLILESYRHHGDGTLPDYIEADLLKTFFASSMLWQIGTASKCAFHS
jgi:hypothetical protein